MDYQDMGRCEHEPDNTLPSPTHSERIRADPSIPLGSEQNPTESHQIPTIFLPRKKKSVPISFRVIPSSFRVHSESFRPTYGFKKKTFLPSQNAKFRLNSGFIPSQF